MIASTPPTWHSKTLRGFNISAWHHIALVVDDLQSIWVYIDGDLIAAFEGSLSVDSISGGIDFFVGMSSFDSEPDSVTSNMSFLLDDLVIFRGALTYGQIEELAAGTLNLELFDALE